MRRIRNMTVVLLAFALGIAVGGAGTATAARLITGKEIKNGSITAKDLSKGLRARLGAPGTPGPAGERGPTGDPGPKGDQGPAGLSLLTFADSSVSGGITLNGTAQVVTSTAGQLPQANGAVGGPLTIPAGPGKYVTTSTLRVKTQGSGSYTCTVQISVTGSAFFDVESESAATDTLRLSVPSGSFLNNAPSTFHYRAVCSGAGTRTVTDADLNVIWAVQPL
jgi:hypothetical protein